MVREQGPTNFPTIPPNYEAFVDYALTHSNRHWDSQVGQLTSETGVYTPTVTHRFEDINDLWDQYFDVPIKHLKTSKPYAVNEYRLPELEAHYQQDLVLWEQCKTPRG